MKELKVIEQSGLIKVFETKSGEKVVDARELHAGLLSRQQFADWIKARLEECDAVAGVDYSTFHNVMTREGSNLGAKRTEYILKLSIAKEMAMLERNDQGKVYRKYLISIEEKYNKSKLDMSKLSSEIQMLNQMILSMAHQELEIKSAIDKADKALDHVENITDTIVKQFDDWRSELNHLFNKTQKASGISFQDLRTKTYEALEKRSGCDLAARVRNLKNRLKDEGATKTKINAISKVDVIEADKKLREIYTQIIKEYAISYSVGEVRRCL